MEDNAALVGMAVSILAAILSVYKARVEKRKSQAEIERIENQNDLDAVKIITDSTIEVVKMYRFQIEDLTRKIEEANGTAEEYKALKALHEKCQESLEDLEEKFVALREKDRSVDD